MKKCIVFIILFLAIIFIVINLLNIELVKNVFNNEVSESVLNLENSSHMQVNSDSYYEGNSSSSFSPIFKSQTIPNSIYERIIGNSIPIEYKNRVDLTSLAYLQISYWGFDNLPHTGEMIVNSKLQNDVIEIFKELYDIHYPIEKIKLIDEYNANDEASMSDNNSSAFCYRVIAGTNSLSNHSKRLRY